MSKHRDPKQRLLPWYVNGTLTEAEMAHMEEQRRNNLDFQQAIDVEIGMARLFSADIPSLAPALAQQPQSFEQLRGKIAGQRRFSAWRTISQKRVPVYALAASVLLTTCLSFLLWSIVSRDSWQPIPADYEVLTDLPDTNGVVVQLIFKPGLDSETIQQLLESRAVTTVSGPSVNRVYRVQVENRDDLQFWQQHPQVRWAELESP